jgi:hypothetical protein
VRRRDVLSCGGSAQFLSEISCYGDTAFRRKFWTPIYFVRNSARGFIVLAAILDHCGSSAAAGYLAMRRFLDGGGHPRRRVSLTAAGCDLSRPGPTIWALYFFWTKFFKAAPPPLPPPTKMSMASATPPTTPSLPPPLSLILGYRIILSRHHVLRCGLTKFSKLRAQFIIKKRGCLLRKPGRRRLGSTHVCAPEAVRTHVVTRRTP